MTVQKQGIFFLIGFVLVGVMAIFIDSQFLLGGAVTGFLITVGVLIYE